MRYNRRMPAILTFDVRVIRQPALLEAALSRIAQHADQGAGPVVVCPAPLALAGALRRAGQQCAVVAASDVEFLRRIAGLGAVVLLEGTQREAIELAAVLEDAKVVVYSDSQSLAVEYASHVELMELAEQRSSPVNDDAAREAYARGVSYEIRRVTSDEGTVIRTDGYEDRRSPVTSIATSSGFTLFTVGAKSAQSDSWKQLQMQILQHFAQADVSVEMLQAFPFGVRFLAPSSRLGFMEHLCAQYQLGLHVVEGCAKICVVGTGVRSTAGVFYRSLASLERSNVPVLHWADSNVTLSFVVSQNLAKLSERTLQEALAPGGAIGLGSAIAFDASLGIVRMNGREVRLGARQGQLLSYFLDNTGRILEAEELARQLFGSDGKEDLAAVRVHLHNLRKKIEDDPETPRHIVTVPDQGYVFVL